MFTNRASMRRVGVFVLLITVLAAPVSTISAQDNTLAPGRAVKGTISNTAYLNTWRYESSGNETISVSVEATSGNLDTTLVVVSSNLDVLGVNDDIDPANDNFNSAVNNLFIPNADTIFVLVSRFGTQNGSSSGSYSLLLTSGGASTGVVPTEPAAEPDTLTLDEAAINGKLQAAFDHLVALGVVPDWEGTILLQIPDGAFLESFREDEHQLFMRVGQGREAADVIIRTDFIWDGDDDTVACGVDLRSQNNGDSYTVYVGRAGWVELGRWSDGGETWNSLAVWDVTGMNTRDGGKNNLVITAVDDEFHIFVNYELVGTVTDSAISGAGELYLALFKDTAKHLRCDYPNFWVITQDQ